VIGWQDAPPGIFGLWSIQVAQFEPEVIPARGRLVPALFTFLPRCRGVARRAVFMEMHIAEARSDLAQQCLSEGRLRQAPAHTATASKANDLGERLFRSRVADKEAE
jgi:hypothetical protein